MAVDLQNSVWVRWTLAVQFPEEHANVYSRLGATRAREGCRICEKEGESEAKYRQTHDRVL